MKISDKYWRIAQRLQTQELQKLSSDKFRLSDDDLFNLDIGRRGGSFFLGFYSEEGIRLALTKYGIYDDLNKLGFDQIITTIHTDDPYKHRIAFYYKQRQQKNLLVDLVLRKSHTLIKMPFESENNNKSYLGLKIDWLNMQNIRGTFSDERPRLPGQKYPGLGMSAKVVELLMIICWRLRLSAIINVPEHYHNAYLYSRIFYYIDPETEGLLIALKKTFEKFTLDKISWGVDWGCVIELNSGAPLKWPVSQQIIPIDPELRALFTGKIYNEYAEKSSKKYKFEFDEQKYKRLRGQMSETMMEKPI